VALHGILEILSQLQSTSVHGTAGATWQHPPEQAPSAAKATLTLTTHINKTSTQYINQAVL
jgi:hypothetical protein